jgi:predicted lipoprotein
MSLSGFDMIFRAIGIDPQMFIQAVQEIQNMAQSIAIKSAATDQKMERIEDKLDMLLAQLGIEKPAGLLPDVRNTIQQVRSDD